jgi:prevent-host-death family protein
MNEIGIKELKTRASAIVRTVREDQVQYVITHRGRPAALLVPIHGPVSALVKAGRVSDRAVWAELEQLGKEIGRGWQAPETSAELVSSMRR